MDNVALMNRNAPQMGRNVPQLQNDTPLSIFFQKQPNLILKFIQILNISTIKISKKGSKMNHNTFFIYKIFP